MASHVMTQAERMCLHSAACDLHIGFRGVFGEETIESLLLDSYAELASTSTADEPTEASFDPGGHGGTLTGAGRVTRSNSAFADVRMCPQSAPERK